jgi:hypothetical protein
MISKYPSSLAILNEDALFFIGVLPGEFMDIAGTYKLTRLTSSIFLGLLEIIISTSLLLNKFFR